MTLTVNRPNVESVQAVNEPDEYHELRAEDEEDLQILRDAEERYAGLDWKATFKPLD